MIIVDTLVVIAVSFDEPSSAALLARLALDPDCLISVTCYLEAGTVLAGRRRTDRMRAIDDLDRFLDEAGISLAPVEVDQARLTLHARIQYCRGMGYGGALNFGDCFSYALAKVTGSPPLFVGDDFGTTDVAVALRQDEANP